MDQLIITGLTVRDIRYPTSVGLHGSDAMHKSPDYSAPYVVLTTNSEIKSYGLTFTIGRGTEIVVCAVTSYKHMVVGKKLTDITKSFGKFWHDLVNEDQLRWIGPEKGATHLAIAAIINAIWDLWGRVEKKPVWKLLADMSPEEIVSLIDFTYIEDFVSPKEALIILRKNYGERKHREIDIIKSGYPAYTTSSGWLGYTDDEVKEKCQTAMNNGFKHFKLKIGEDIDDDLRRMKIIRECIGAENNLMVDANQRWSTVQQAVDWVTRLAPLAPYWIEEPTSPDDVSAHDAIGRLLAPLGVRVATGEHCQNRVLFKQFLQSSHGMRVCQVDACRLGGLNEVIAVLLMAQKAGVPVCPHAGGVGLTEYVQHIVAFDYICVSGSLDGRMCEYADHCHEYFVKPVKMKNGAYVIPEDPGYSAEMIEELLENYEFPHGQYWKAKQQ